VIFSCTNLPGQIYVMFVETVEPEDIYDKMTVVTVKVKIYTTT